jgi:hypothetical protein
MAAAPPTVTPMTQQPGWWKITVPNPKGGSWDVTFASQAEARAFIAAIKDGRFTV